MRLRFPPILFRVGQVTIREFAEWLCIMLGLPQNNFLSNLKFQMERMTAFHGVSMQCSLNQLRANAFSLEIQRKKFGSLIAMTPFMNGFSATVRDRYLQFRWSVPNSAQLDRGRRFSDLDGYQQFIQ